MEKYKAIQQLMAVGEFRKALDHLSRILKKNPQDKEAEKLEHICRDMIHIQNACREKPEQKNSISAEEYISVHFRRFMKELCRLLHLASEYLPSAWQKKLNVERFKTWENNFTIEEDSLKDLLWESLFWDTRRRITVFSVLIAVLFIFSTLLFFLTFGGCSISSDVSNKDIPTLLKEAFDDDAEAQFQLGKNFYEGRNVKKDLEQANLWLTKAARSGHTRAAQLLQKLLVEQEISYQDGEQLWKKKDKSKSEFLQ